jgi:hypothetical protein
LDKFVNLWKFLQTKLYSPYFIGLQRSLNEVIYTVSLPQCLPYDEGPKVLLLLFKYYGTSQRQCVEGTQGKQGRKRGHAIFMWLIVFTYWTFNSFLAWQGVMYFDIPKHTT